ncbi:MAG: hypothetical protein ACI9MR_001457 [Myxococcota bacterium]|jgi:hypothetical protein
MKRVTMTVFALATLVFAVSSAQAQAPTYVDIGDALDGLPLLCDGDVAFDVIVVPSGLNPKGTKQLIVDNAPFGVGIETVDHLEKLTKNGLRNGHFYVLFTSLVDVLVSLGEPDLTARAFAHQALVEELFDALETAKRLRLYQAVESQGGNADYLFIYDTSAGLLSTLELSCG